MEPFAPSLDAWRAMRLGSREYIDAVVAPAHRGPSPELRQALASWPGVHYWTAPDHSGLVLVRPIASPPRERWLLHLLLAAITALSALGAGAALTGAWQPTYIASQFGAVGSALAAGVQFFVEALSGGWRELLPGAPFALALLSILLVHELGHFVAARRYGIDTSPPYFLPVPPSLSPIGSLGAFIRLRSPVLDRQQLLDVGAAGPLAGFAVVLVALIYGYGQSELAVASPYAAGDFVTFAGRRLILGDSLLTWGLRGWFFPGAESVHLSLPAFAGWVGAFVTGLNLLPLSQLDGGHVHYALFGRRQTTIGGLALLLLLVLGTVSASWLVWAALALAVGGGRWAHPSVVAPARPVPWRRRWVGWAAIAVFVVTFVPVPFHL